ncbi:MAG TPA: DsbA family protein [Solirubrobacteraceae bacterium]
MSGKESLQPPRTVVVYGDYLDPFTRGACATIEEAGGRVEFHHFPAEGLAAAVAAEAARELGAFEAMHRALLHHAGTLSTDDIRAQAHAAGLDPEAFEGVFGSDEQLARIRADVQAAAARGVDAPPALFLDGERLASYELSWLRDRLAR